MMLRVEVLTDYGDTCLVRSATPILYGARGRPAVMRPIFTVARADLVEEHQIVKRTKSGGRSSDMASSSPSSHLAPAPEATPC